MERLLDNFSLQNNFWKFNPQFLSIREFRELYNEDKKDKKASSNLMWGIALLEHPGSILKELSEIDRLELVATDYLHLPEFDWGSVSKLRGIFSSLVTSKQLKSLIMWERKLEERDQFISETPYNMNTADSLDKIMANTERLYKHFKSIKADLMKDGSESVEKGGSLPSLSDTGEI
jgi:hypothetical protein